VNTVAFSRIATIDNPVKDGTLALSNLLLALLLMKTERNPDANKFCLSRQKGMPYGYSGKIIMNLENPKTICTRKDP
jgi:hypothetical protein